MTNITNFLDICCDSYILKPNHESLIKTTVSKNRMTFIFTVLHNDSEINDEHNDQEINDEHNDQEVNDQTEVQEINDEHNDQEINNEHNDQEVNDQTEVQEINDEHNDHIKHVNIQLPKRFSESFNKNVCLTNNISTHENLILYDINDKLLRILNRLFEEDKSTNVVTNEKHNSKELGEIGETAVLTLLQEIKPKAFVELVSQSSHCGDIHIKDTNKKTMYMIEVKNKKAISKDDISKFHKDLKDITNKFKEQFEFIYGIFISLNDEVKSIPQYGSLKVIENTIYITHEYFNNVSMSLIFEFIEDFHRYKKPTEKTEFILTQHIIDLIGSLRIEKINLETDIEKLKKIINNNDDNNKHLRQLLNSEMLRYNTVEHILKMINNDTEQIEESIEEHNETRFSNWLKSSKKKSSLTKKEMISQFPEIENIISSMKMSDIWKKYG
jgi:hypothetical protein